MTTVNVRNVGCWYCRAANVELVRDEQGILWGRCVKCGTGYTVGSFHGGPAVERDSRPLKAIVLHLVRRARGRTGPPLPVDLCDLAKRRQRMLQDGQEGGSLFDRV